MSVVSSGNKRGVGKKPSLVLPRLRRHEEDCWPCEMHSPFEADPALWDSIDPNHVLDFDMMISNYGRVQNKEPGQLALKALYPACVAGQDQTQTVMLATVDEIVHLSHISREPQKGLVGRALNLLREAVNG